MRYGACRISIRTNDPGTIGFYVISLRGKLIRRFDAVPAGVHSFDFIWDGIDRFNRPVSVGVYLGIASSKGKIIGSRILRR